MLRCIAMQVTVSPDIRGNGKKDAKMGASFFHTI